MSSSTDSSFWKEQASATLARERVEAEAQDLLRLHRLDVSSATAGSLPRSTSFNVSPRSPRRSVSSAITSSGGMLPRLTVRPEVLDEPRLARLRRRLEDQVGDGDLVRDLVDEAGAHLAGRPVDAGGAALAALGDHLPRAGGELFLDPLDPLVRGEDDVGVLRADLGEDGEVAGEVGDQLELALAREVDRAVRDLDVREAELAEPALVLVDLALRETASKKRAADHDRLALQHARASARGWRDVARCPSRA